MDSGDIGFILAAIAIIAIGIIGFRRADWRNDQWWVIGPVVALLVLLIGYAVYDHQRWGMYRDAHHCAETGETKLTMITQCQTVGKVTICTPHPVTQYEWECDGDEIVWR